MDEEEVNNDIMATAELELELAHSVVKPTDTRTSRTGEEVSSSPFKLSNVKPSKIDSDENIVSSNPVISGLFSTRNPRDITSAVGSGIKSITKGVVIGTTSLVLCPVVGVTNDGVTGFFKGVGAGVLAAITLPLAGIGVSLYQVGRGAINTPKAICEKASGKVWNKEKRVWEENWYSLEEEAKMLKEYRESHKESSVPPPNKETYEANTDVFETELYEILQVSPNATQETIRRAYYRLAKKYHPDKNINVDGEEDFNHLFHRLGEAYQILGDEQRRKKYDKYGRSAISDMSIMDSQLFFSMLFGSDTLEPYIGKLRMALYLELEINENFTPTTHDFEKLQQAREVEIALNLREFLRSFVCGELDEFRNHVRAIASDLCKSSFTVAIIETLGWTYQNYAKQYIGKRTSFLGLSGRLAKSKQKTRSFGKGLKTFSYMFKTAVLERGRRSDDSEQVISDVGVNYNEESIPVILDAMLNICLMDIQNTVRASCKRLLKDMSVDSSWRYRRAEALLEAGVIFLQVARELKPQFTGGQSTNEVDQYVNEIKERRQVRKNVHYSNDAFY
ncbi:molecular chaperone DnaJ [Theileria orientalis]|uniref:Molecular chaperone DnaJ n=1 Tax=Theileria orientalis TaxID=68886 RepID=A0A976M7X0_THEOR|nr:molecular chaperone DnaJ [Theileria orientalis]